MRKMMNLIIVVTICFLLSIFLMPVLGAHAQEKAKVYNWRFFVSYPPAMFPIMPSYPEMIRKATNGQLDIKLFFFGEHPYKGSEIMTAIRDKRCQMGEIEAAYYAGSEPVLSLTGGPLLATTEQIMFKMKLSSKQGYWIQYTKSTTCLKYPTGPGGDHQSPVLTL